MMNELKRIVVVGTGLALLVGCSRQVEPPKPAPAAPAAPEPAKPVAAPVAGFPEGICATGLVVALSFTEGVDNTVPGNAKIRPAGEPTIVDDGRFGSGCRLADGATLCVPNLAMTANGTWGLWVRPDAKQAGAVSRIMDANAYGFFLKGKTLSIAYNDGKSLSLPGPDIPSEEWTHLAMTWGEGTLKLYVNGEMHGQRVIRGAPAFPMRKLFIGSRWTGSSMSFSGIIDDVVIYRWAISGEEMKKLVEQGLR